jgi:hypothetical protein
MKQSIFHHPDISFTVVRRTISAELIDMLGVLSQFVLTRGKSASWVISNNSEKNNLRAALTATKPLQR